MVSVYTKHTVQPHLSIPIPENTAEHRSLQRIVEDNNTSYRLCVKSKIKSKTGETGVKSYFGLEP